MPRSDDENDRPRRRRRRDDDEDDRPVRSRRDEEDDEDDYDDRPRRRKKAGGMSPLAIVGIVGGVLLLFGCCGGGAVWWLVSAGGFGRDVTLTNAHRPGVFMNRGVRVEYRVNAAPPPGQTYVVVARTANGGTIVGGFIPPLAGAAGSTDVMPFGFADTSGTMEVWVERRAGGAGFGTKVSNTVTVR